MHAKKSRPGLLAALSLLPMSWAADAATITTLEFGVSPVVQLEPLSYNWSVFVQGGGSGAQPVFSDFSWSQVVDAGTPTLFGLLVNGTEIPTVTLTLSDDDPKRGGAYFRMIFDEVLINFLSLGGSGFEAPLVSGAFNYSAVTLEYTARDTTGKALSPVISSYNLATNQGNAAQFMSVYSAALADLPVVVPVPPALLLLASALGLLGVMRRRRAGIAAGD